jgi:diguanylate cyclase (GGDEF)-like protein
MTREIQPDPSSHDLIQSCPIGVVTVDADGKINTINQSLTDILGVSEHDLKGVHRDNVPGDGLKALLSGNAMVSVKDQQGREHILSHTQVSPENLPASGSIHYFMDQTELFLLKQEKELLNQEVSKLQLSDPATGLHTQRAIMLILEPQVSQCRRYQNPLSIMLLSVGFTSDSDSIADVDKKILKISRILKDQVRWADMIGRTGENQMILILPETAIDAASQLAEKIQARLTQLDDIHHVYTGLTEWKKSDNAAHLLHRADAALQQAEATAQSGTVVL